MFVIEDELHAEPDAEFETLAEAVAELKRRAERPWDRPPNRAPCTSWRTCGRAYLVLEVDDSVQPWRELRRIAVCEISASGVRWLADDPPSAAAAPD